MVPVQAGVLEVWVALQEGGRTVHSFPEVVVVTTELSSHAYEIKPCNECLLKEHCCTI